MLYEDTYLAHHGIKGQRWGIRRFQNTDGTLTPEGKKRYYSEESRAGKDFDKGVKNGKYTKDPEIKEIFIMEQLEKSKNTNSVKKQTSELLNNPPSAFLEIGKNALEKMRSGKILSDEELRSIQESAWKKFKNREANTSLLEKFQSATDQNEKEKIKLQFKEQDLAINYAYEQLPAVNRMKKYEQAIGSFEDEKNIDPSYRTFSSKAEKAKAEADYLKRSWYDNDVLADEAKAKVEALHIADRVCNLSYDGYNQVPRSKRMCSMFRYNGDFDADDPYAEKWEPKSKEWDALVEERRQIYKTSGVNEAYKKYSEALKAQKVNELGKNVNVKKLYKAYSKAHSEFSKLMDSWREKEKAFYKEFDKKIAKNVLLDLGYEVTESNLNLIKNIIWWD